MEELPGATQSRRVSFKTHHESASHTNGNLENQRRMRDHEHLRMKEKSSCSSHYRSLEIPKGPIHAMQFLCRSWSPSASHFLQIFPPSSLLLPLNDNNRMENQEEKQEVGGKVEDIAQSNRNTLNIIKNISGWLRGKTMTSLVNGHRAQKKDEVRLHTAQVHAALSVAQLAAAIAGFAANSSTEAAQDINIHATNGGIVTRDKDMSAVASAAALVATVCAEAAESVGARRAHITSAVSSGLASRTSVDMMALTATAATCLRGATRLKSRATVDTYSLRNQKMLKVGVQLSVIMPSGHKEHQWVSIYLKHKHLILRLRKKYLKGLLPTSKECMIPLFKDSILRTLYRCISFMIVTDYIPNGKHRLYLMDSLTETMLYRIYALCLLNKIINATDKAEEVQGYCSLNLKINDGDIKLLFADRKQSSVWISTISNLLQLHKTC